MGLKNALLGGGVAFVGLCGVLFVFLSVLLAVSVKLGLIALALLVLWFILHLLGMLPPPPMPTEAGVPA